MKMTKGTKLFLLGLIFICLCSSVNASPFWSQKEMAVITECVLETDTVTVSSNAQTGPGNGVERLNENTLRIYFASDDIPTVGNYYDYDLYYVDFDLSTKSFGRAHDIDIICADSINTESMHESCPVISPDGQYLFFTKTPENNETEHQIWMAEKNNLGFWDNAHVLGDTINAGYDEHIGSYREGKMYFSARGRDGGAYFEIWMCDFDPETEIADNVVKLNFVAGADESGGFIAPDGERIYFHSAGLSGAEGSEICYSEWDENNAEWKEAKILSSNVNGSGGETRPGISGDYRFLFFTSSSSPANTNRLFYCERTPIPHDLVIKDVPRDQGGKLHVQWKGSFADTIPNDLITHYSVWRRIETLYNQNLLTSNLNGEDRLNIPVDFKGEATRISILGGGYTWEWIDNVPAKYNEEYALLVESLYDSLATNTGWQYFMVTAHTDTMSVFYNSPIDSGYSVDNLSPAAPLGIAMEEGSLLQWDDNSEIDLDGYEVYGRETCGGPALYSYRVYKSEFDVSESVQDGCHFWDVAAVDCHGNRSELAEPEMPTDVDDMPTANALNQNYPNPFNPHTEISFSIEKRDHVFMGIYDVSGKLVKVLKNRTMGAGTYSVKWNGTNEDGRNVTSGVYFYRIKTGEFINTKKMVLLR